MKNNRDFLNVKELVAKTGFPESAIWTLKRQGRIPYLQPAGPRGKVLFPPDALDHLVYRPDPADAAKPHREPKLLSGKEPKWKRLKKQFPRGENDAEKS